VSRWALPLLLLTIVTAGCQSAPRTDGSVAARQFQENLVRSTEAISAGDLDQARVHLAAARAVASGPRQTGKVRSLESLITGAEFLLAGDAEQARDAWSSIEDAELKRQVRSKAEQIGMSVPEELTKVVSNDEA
jgi:hypothetical protein